MDNKEAQSNDNNTQEQEDLLIITKYQLPSKEELIKELGPYDSEDNGLIKTIISKLHLKSQKYTDFLEEMLHPDSTIVSMQESRVFSDKDRENMFALFKQFTLFQRKILLIHLSTNEEEKARYFKEFYVFYISSKNELKKYIKKALSIWSTKEINTNNSLGYMG